MHRQHTTPQTHSTRYLQVTQLRTARPMAVAPGGKRDDDRDLRARTVVHGDRSARRAARHHARLRTHDQNAPRGVSVRRRHRAHRSRNDCHATAARAKSHAQAPHRPACAAATAARSTATGRLGRPAASSSRPSTLVGSGERKESSLRLLEKARGTARTNTEGNPPHLASHPPILSTPSTAAGARAHTFG